MPPDEMTSDDRNAQGHNYSSDFGGALAMLRDGKKVARRGWNGKGMFLYLVPAASYPAQTDAAKQAFGDMVPYSEYIAMRTVQDVVVPWCASQTCLLADDWHEVTAIEAV